MPLRCAALGLSWNTFAAPFVRLIPVSSFCSAVNWIGRIQFPFHLTLTKPLLQTSLHKGTLSFTADAFCPFSSFCSFPSA